MGMIHFSCPACGKHLKAGPQCAGRTTSCPVCHASVAVPDLSPESAVPDLPAAPAIERGAPPVLGAPPEWAVQPPGVPDAPDEFEFLDLESSIEIEATRDPIPPGAPQPVPGMPRTPSRGRQAPRGPGRSSEPKPAATQVRMLRFDCTGCGKVVQVPDHLAGKKARCPHCSAVLDVPAAAAVPAPAVPARAVPARAIPAPAVPARAIPARAIPAPAVPAAGVPAPAVPSPGVPAPAAPAPAVPAPAARSPGRASRPGRGRSSGGGRASGGRASGTRRKPLGIGARIWFVAGGVACFLAVFGVFLAVLLADGNGAAPRGVTGEANKAESLPANGMADPLEAARAAIVRSLEGRERVEADLEGLGRVALLGADAEGVELGATTGLGGLRRIRRSWTEVAPRDLLAMMAACGLEETGAFRQLADQYGRLARVPDPEPDEPDRTGDRPAPEPEGDGGEDWDLPRPDETPGGGPEAPGAGPEVPGANTGEPAVDAGDLSDLPAKLARQEFPIRLERLESLRLAFLVEECLEELDRYAGELRALGLADLVTPLDDLRSGVEGERRLKERLVETGSIDVFGDLPMAGRSLSVGEVRFDAKRVELVLQRGGSVEFLWQHLPADLAGALLERAATTFDLALAAARFHVDRGHTDLAAPALSRLHARHGKTQGAAIDALVARFRGMPVPEGGFLFESGNFLTRTEKELRDLGLVFFDGQWMTKADHDRIRSGWALEEGLWLPKDHLDRLRALPEPGEDAFVRAGGRWTYKFQKEVGGDVYYSFQGKYLPRSEVASRRRVWKTAWKIETEHFRIQANVDERLLIAIANVLEAAWPVYVARIGAEPRSRLEYFGFGTFEDYRNYAVENGYGDVVGRAQGFCDPKNNRGVGYLGHDLDYFFTTAVHEVGHLFYHVVYPESFPNSWYSEGLAVSLQQVVQKGASFEFPGVDAREAKELVLCRRQGRMPRIADLVRSTSTSAAEAGWQSEFYQASWALFWFLETLDESRWPALHRAWRDYEQKVACGKLIVHQRSVFGPGEEPFEVVLASAGIAVAGVESAWQKWIDGHAAGWVALDYPSLSASLLGDLRVEQGAAGPAPEVATTGDIPFRGGNHTLEEIRAILASEAGGSPGSRAGNGRPAEGSKADIVTRRTPKNTLVGDDPKISVSIPENEAWSAEKASESSLGIGTGVFVVQKERGGETLVRIECVELVDRFAYGNEIGNPADPRGVLAIVQQVVLDRDPTARAATDEGKYSRERFARALLRCEDGRHRLLVTTIQNERPGCFLFLVEFAPGAHEVSAAGVDSILEHFEARP
ncbi:MAG: hypothetical protein HY720_27475 [Planctomycetes bacterium]|nr:hypothetical protein [Planctomycetota bacterium]